MLCQQFRRAKAVVVRKVVRDHRLARVHGVARRRREIGADRRDPDHALVPSDARADEQTIPIGQILQDLAEAGVESQRGQTDGLLEDAFDGNVAERAPPEFGEQRLLPQPVFKLRFFRLSGRLV